MQFNLSRRGFLKHSVNVTFGVGLAQLPTVALETEALIPDFPYFSQQHWSAPAAYDCGESCFRMMLLWRANELGIDPTTVMTVPQIAALWGKTYDEESWADIHMLPNIGDMGFVFEYSASAVNDWYREQLRAGYPCVALVSYGGFAPHNRAMEYSAGHYVVVVGFDDDGFVIHDPLYINEIDGAYRHISLEEWWVSSQGAGFAMSGLRSSVYDV